MNAPVQHWEAAREVLSRRAVRRSLIEWGRYKGYEAAQHHRLICDEIEAFLESDVIWFAGSLRRSPA